MIAATLIALLSHLQVVPLVNLEAMTVDCCAAVYVEPTSTSRYSVKVARSDLKGTTVTLGAHWKF